MQAPIYESENIAVRSYTNRRGETRYALYRPNDKLRSAISDFGSAENAITAAKIIDEHGGSFRSEVRKLFRHLR